MFVGPRRGLSTYGILIVLLVLVLAAVSVVFVTSSQSTADQLNAQGGQISTLQSELQKLSAGTGQGGGGGNLTLPVMDQTPTIRTITETWYISPSAHQDRFEPSFIIVNQGDTVKLTLIDNDTVAHDFVIGPPYSIVVNATVPGLVNDLTGQKFTTPARNNSPGVVVTGAPGNVSASYSFVAKYAGIYEFVCTYHAQVGMIGYLAVLPNLGYSEKTTQSTSGQAPKSVAVSIVSGAAANTTAKGFSPDRVVVVLGVNNTLTWTNNDTSPHTVTADDGTFQSGNLAPGQSYTFTFTSPGTYSYHCTYHPWMVGTVVVEAGP